MNAKDAYQNALWNKLPYDLKQSIFAATEINLIKTYKL